MIQDINIGELANDGTGDVLRNAFDKANQNFTLLLDQINSLNAALEDFEGASPGDVVNGISVYDSTKTYIPGVDFIVFYNNKVYGFVSSAEQTDVEPGTNATVWQEIPWSMLAHQRNRDSKLANYPVYYSITESGEWNIHTADNIDKNIFVLEDTTGTGTKNITFPLLDVTSFIQNKVKHEITIYVSPNDDSTYVFAQDEGFRTPKGEDIVLTKGQWMTLRFIDVMREVTSGAIIEGVFIVSTTSNLSTYLTLPEESIDIMDIFSSVALTEGKVLYVDVVNGDDTTAIIGASNLPFGTINGALSEAVSGDMLYVKRGTYTANYILNDGVDIWFEPGCTVNGSSILSSSNTSGIFSIDCNIYGFPVIEGTTRGMFIQNKRGSNMYLELGDVTCTGDNGIRIQDCEDVNIELNIKGDVSGVNSPYRVQACSGRIDIKAKSLIVSSVISTSLPSSNNAVVLFTGTQADPLTASVDVEDFTFAANAGPSIMQYSSNATVYIKLKNKTTNETASQVHTYGIDHKWGDLTFDGELETNECFAYGCSYSGSPGKFILTEGSILKSTNNRAMSISMPGGEYEIHGDLYSGAQYAVVLLNTGITFKLTGYIENSNTTDTNVSGIYNNQVDLTLLLDGSRVKAKDYSIYSTVPLVANVVREFNYTSPPNINTNLASEYQQFPGQAEIKGSVLIDLTGEAGTEHNYDIGYQHSGYTLRFVSNESDEITAYVNDEILLENPITLLMDYTGTLTLKSYLPVVLYGKDVVPVNVRDEGWLADVAAYTFYLENFLSLEEVAYDRVEFETNGNYESITVAGTSLVVQINSAEISDDVTEFMAYLVLNPISIGSKQVISTVYDTVQFIKLDDNLIRVI